MTDNNPDAQVLRTEFKITHLDINNYKWDISVNN